MTSLPRLPSAAGGPWEASLSRTEVASMQGCAPVSGVTAQGALAAHGCGPRPTCCWSSPIPGTLCRDIASIHLERFSKIGVVREEARATRRVTAVAMLYRSPGELRWPRRTRLGGPPTAGYHPYVVRGRCRIAADSLPDGVTPLDRAGGGPTTAGSCSSAINRKELI